MEEPFFRAPSRLSIMSYPFPGYDFKIQGLGAASSRLYATARGEGGGYKHWHIQDQPGTSAGVILNRARRYALRIFRNGRCRSGNSITSRIIPVHVRCMISLANLLLARIFGP